MNKKIERKSKKEEKKKENRVNFNILLLFIILNSFFILDNLKKYFKSFYLYLIL